jgi:hypothetical protein
MILFEGRIAMTPRKCFPKTIKNIVIKNIASENDLSLIHNKERHCLMETPPRKMGHIISPIIPRNRSQPKGPQKDTSKSP